MTIYLLAAVLVAMIGILIYINTGAKLPPNSSHVINEVLEGDVPEMITGATGFAKSGELDIWYENMMPNGNPKGTVLLIMGHSSSAMLWTSEFYQPILDAGYQVVRYDNRDVGMSTWIKNWNRRNPYTLNDMTRDGIAVLDALNVEKAHVIGASMGGMIAQQMAISYPDRTATLNSIMSSGYMMDPDITPVPKWFMANFIKLGARYMIPGSEKGNLKFFIGVLNTLKGDGPYEMDVKLASHIMLYETRKRRGINKKAIRQQAKAIEIADSRLDGLSKISAPTLVIHGKADPLIIFEHAKKYAAVIPNVKTLFIEGMGHDFPTIYKDQIHDSLFQNLERAE